MSHLRLSLIVSSLLVSTPALAHNIEIAGDVAGTWHIEPDHNPQVGEAARVWIALTRQGGALLPFSETNCQLKVYPEPRTAAKPLLTPTLKAIAAEQYQGIPGADLVFPQAGAYTLELHCTPKAPNDFQAFQMDYPVTVTGSSVSQAPISTNVAKEPAALQTARSERWLVPPFILVVIWVGWSLLRRRSE